MDSVAACLSFGMMRLQDSMNSIRCHPRYLHTFVSPQIQGSPGANHITQCTDNDNVYRKTNVHVNINMLIHITFQHVKVCTKVALCTVNLKYALKQHE